MQYNTYQVHLLSKYIHCKLFNGLFSRTTQIGRYQKDKPFRIFWSINDGVAAASAEPHASSSSLNLC